MLASLRIENFAIVSFLELDFKNGMTAFTGETGAGKSIMIDALLLALGGRGEASVVRPNAEKCDICATFLIEANSPLYQWLIEHDIPCDEKEIVLRRTINSEGRSKSYINGLPFPLQKVKELAETVVDIHGQHQHQTLLNPTTHRLQLDQFANHTQLLEKVGNAYHAYQKIAKQIDSLKEQGNTTERQSLLRFQQEELQKVDVKEGEIQVLHEEHQLLHHAKEFLHTSQTIAGILNNEENHNILSGLHQILQLLATLPKLPPIQSTSELINTAIIQCEEALDEIEKFTQDIELDPERLQAVEERMGLLHQIARKYHIDPSAIPHHLKHIEEELEQLQNSQGLILKLEEEYIQKLNEYESLAGKLRESRQEAAKHLTLEITKTIQKLGMPKGFIAIDITPLEKNTAYGMDKVEYKVCTNPGMQPESLGKVASGGELSRISLAIHLITAQKGSTPTLLFDEVDVGIGGATAALVGQYLRKLGERLQLFCVTHQPQVAACAHHHFFVEKFTKEEETFSKVSLLCESEKINEIARMLGGLTITEQTLSNARELFLLSQGLKANEPA
ncbi:DNA repair ATPase (plasmid) [Legionella adelaidensis]|uniref:DNA repair protein RecN n=1 Tax=Legionella adelaidensis TaxID=45056 RepID=A0A0W0R3T5_9GAMM|nr:DNA repair protein RecN [Legionella adelaidensis]KTC65705.1 DNA repair protein recN [Legionella adelaidensis]VEH85987.1 DNA repair ATPase [Legionella adelaidensis]